jgi:hypothetical protein
MDVEICIPKYYGVLAALNLLDLGSDQYSIDSCRFHIYVPYRAFYFIFSPSPQSVQRKWMCPSAQARPQRDTESRL